MEAPLREDRGQAKSSPSEWFWGGLHVLGLLLSLLEPMLWLAAGVAFVLVHWKLSLTIGGSFLIAVLLLLWLWWRLDGWTERGSA